MNKLDASNDRGYVQLNRLLEQYGPLPEYVKQADHLEVSDPQGLRDAAYADPANRQFPCHTKAAVYVSSLYFLDNIAKLPPAQANQIATRLEKAAEDHGILAEVESLVQRSCELIKAATDNELPGSDAGYALVKHSASGVERRYPLRNGKEVLAAANWLQQYRDDFRFEDRRQMAERILDKAAEFSTALPTELDVFLDRQAGRGVYDPKVAAEQLRRRALLPNVAPQLRTGLEKLSFDLESNPLLAEDPTTSCQLAATLDMFDREHRVKYSRLLSRPEDILFAGSLKYAQCFMDETCPLVTGTIYHTSQFQKLSTQSIRDTLGDDVANSVDDGFGVDVAKLAEIATTLPLPDAVQFDRLMQRCGEEPVHHKSASAELVEADRQELARQYRVQTLAKAAV